MRNMDIHGACLPIKIEAPRHLKQLFAGEHTPGLARTERRPFHRQGKDAGEEQVTGQRVAEDQLHASDRAVAMFGDNDLCHVLFDGVLLILTRATSSRGLKGLVR